MNIDLQQELEIIGNALGFLQRTELKGSETVQFMNVQQYLNEKGNELNEQVLAQQKAENAPVKPVK